MSTNNPFGRPDSRRFGEDDPDIHQDVDDELAFHLEMRQHDYRARGLSDADARAEALRRFGDVERVADACLQIDATKLRSRHRARVLEDLKQDATFAVRTFRRAPGFAILALLVLSVGIGANTAIFTVMNAVLLRPLPFPDADRLVFLWSTRTDVPRDNLTPGRLLDFRERMKSFDGLAGLGHVSFNLTGRGEPERLFGASVSTNFFDVLGATTTIGRTFHAGERSGSAVVLTHGLWKRRFASDLGIVGRRIVLNGTAHVVLGVLPETFVWPIVAAMPVSEPGPELFAVATMNDVPAVPMPIAEDYSRNRTMGFLRAVGRLKRDVTVASAQAEADAVASVLGRDYPDTDGGRGATLTPMSVEFLGHVRTPLALLAGAVAFVLAIACANVASLLLSRATARRRELAVRLALGAGRGRLVRQLLTESVLLSLAAAAVGTLLAWWTLSGVAAFSPVHVLRLEQARLDGAALAFTIAIACLTGVLFGVLPALHASSADPHDTLKAAGRGSDGPAGRGTREALVVAQLAVALVLLVGAGLLIKSFLAVERVPIGFDTSNLLTFELYLTGARAEYQSRQTAFYEELLERVSAIPSVRSAAAAVTLPIGGDDFGSSYVVEGRPRPPAGQEPRVGYQVVTRNYFRTTGIPIVRGRDFLPTDNTDADPAVIISESLAKQAWPGEDAVGKRMRTAGSQNWSTVVGVVGDIHHRGPDEPARAEFYEPITQRSFPFINFVVRTAGDPLALVPAVRERVAEVDPSQPIARVKTMDAHLHQSKAERRFLATLLGFFAGAALLLCSVGVYATMAYTVTQRRLEIGIRMALGARPSTIIAMVVRQGALLAVAGAAIGLPAALLLSRVLEQQLFETSPRDPAALVGVPIVLVIVAIAAAAVPALRGSREDVVRALGAE